jgi:hypothetical protein
MEAFGSGLVIPVSTRSKVDRGRHVGQLTKTCLKAQPLPTR